MEDALLCEKYVIASFVSFFLQDHSKDAVKRIPINDITTMTAWYSQDILKTMLVLCPLFLLSLSSLLVLISTLL